MIVFLLFCVYIVIIFFWKQRYDIILGTTSGLAYLHEDFHVSIIHRDIKTAVILLDNDLQLKIADFRNCWFSQDILP